jgi:Tfp pilus assembly protein PilX
MSTSRISNERGMALAVAIFALVVIGALVAGTFFAGRLEQSSGQAAVYASQASEAAEAGLIDAVETQLSSSGATLDAMLVGDSMDLPTLTTGTRISAARKVRKLTNSVFLVEALGTRRDGAGASMSDRRLGSLIRLNQANITVNAGLTAIGRIVVGGNSTVSGNDATPSAWAGVDCPTPDSVAGVRYNGTVQQQGSAIITGDPNRVSDNTLNASNIFGGSDFNTLKGLATLILTSNVSGLAPATTGTPPRCNASVESNWGAPTDTASACFDYFPIIYHYGDLSISGSGEGQGILLVEGNLQVQGRIDFYGPVIVSGAVNIRGTGSDDVKFYGGVLAQDVTLDDSRLSGNATVNYSSCAIRRALRGSAVPTPLSERSWVQLYN